MASLSNDQKIELGMLAGLGAAMVAAVVEDSPSAMIRCSMQAVRLAAAPEIMGVLDRVEQLLTVWDRETNGHSRLNIVDQ